MFKNSPFRLVVTLVGVVALLWASLSLIVALPLAGGDGLKSAALRLDLLIASAVLTVCLVGLRVLETKVHRGAFAHAVGTAAFLGVSVAMAAGANSNGVVSSMIKGASIALALVAGSAVIAYLLPMEQAPRLD